MLEFEHMTEPIFGAAIAVHRELGPGLMESVYETVLANELKHRGFRVRRQQAVKLSFAGMEFNEVFRADLIVNDTIIVELKATARFDPVSARQLLIYLRLLRLPVGLVINFGADHQGWSKARHQHVPRFELSEAPAASGCIDERDHLSER